MIYIDKMIDTSYSYDSNKRYQKATDDVFFRKTPFSEVRVCYKGQTLTEEVYNYIFKAVKVEESSVKEEVSSDTNAIVEQEPEVKQDAPDLKTSSSKKKTKK